MLDAIEDLLPCGSNKWKKVALDHYNNEWDTNRDSQMCKRKFDKLWSVIKPIGFTEIPRLVVRAKDIKEKISQMDFGHTKANDSDAESEDAFIIGTRLFETNSSIRRPVSTKRNKVDVAEAIEILGDKQLESAILMSSALESMSSESIDAKELHDLKIKVTCIDDKLSTILDLLSNK